MLRILMVAAAFTLTATPAFAARGGDEVGKEELAAHKQGMKDARQFERKLDRYAKRWQKGLEKDREGKVARNDAKLAELYAEELGRLRELGIPTKAAEWDPDIHPAHPDVIPEEPEPENPHMERIRDELVALRKLQDRRDGGVDARRREVRLLANLQEAAEARADRKEARYDELKARS